VVKSRRVAQISLAVLAQTTMWGVAAGAGQDSRRGPITFAKDVAPIIFQHCARCHRPGETAPFSLLTYADVRRHSQQIVELTESRQMPPWKPAGGFGGPYVGERRLTNEEIATLAAWVAEGASEGNPADLPPVPSWPEGWQLGIPDLVLTMSEPYTVPADGPDVFRNFVLPIPIGDTKYIAALEFRPDNRVAHHANLRIDQTRSSRERDEQDPRPGYEGPISPHAQYPDGHFLGWTPGQLTPRAAEGMAWRLEPGSDLVIQIHMRPSGRPESIQPSIGFFFTDERPARTPVMLRLGRQQIDIPPGESHYVTQDRYTLPVDVHVYGVQPHAHFRAKEVKGFATLPDGTTRWLIFIPNWDFNWQDVYRFAEPVFLPRGTTLSLEWTYDNSSANPRNPDHPPRRVLYGQNSTDEMGDLWVQVLPDAPQGREILFEHFRPKLLAEDAAGYETMLLADPRNAKLHDYVALIYWDLGKVDQAIAHYEAAVRFDPGDANTRYNFATLLVQRGRLDEAVAHLREAIALGPDEAAAHNNLAAVLISQARFEEAVQHFSEALRLEPQSAIRHNNLGQSLVLSGRAADGIPHLRESIRLDADFADAHLNLARALLAQGHVGEAIRLAERAVALTRRENIEALDALAEAYAAADRFEEAAEAEEAAIVLAVSTGSPQIADRLRSRLESYRRRVAFRD
jgi:tetratricopeptide (TPR) repeat protein/mono/diheme cytochrome c family protein